MSNYAGQPIYFLRGILGRRKKGGGTYTTFKSNERSYPIDYKIV
jgi:hypothetical protein